MIRKFVSFVVFLVLATIGGAVYYFIPMGERTLHQHVMRIWEAEETQDFVKEAKATADNAKETVGKELEEVSEELEDVEMPDIELPKARDLSVPKARPRGTGEAPAPAKN